MIEVRGQTFKMIIFNLHLPLFWNLSAFKTNKTREKPSNSFPYFIFCEPLFNTGQQIPEEIFFLSLFIQQSIFELVAQRFGEENCIATKFCIHNVFKLETKPAKSYRLLFRLKAEKATSKNQHVTYFLYSYCVFLRNCT